MPGEEMTEAQAMRLAVAQIVNEWCSTLSVAAQTHISPHDKLALSVGLVKLLEDSTE